MRSIFLAALAAVVCGAAAKAAPGADFDGGVDARAALRAAKDAASAAAPVKAKAFMDRADRDCATIAFEPNGPAVSPAVWLRSTEYQNVCTPVGDPRRGGTVVCHEEPVWTNTQTVQLELRGRGAPLPWERETFEACLEGPWLSVWPLATAYDYAQSQSGGYFTLTAGARKPMDPDPAGITAGAPTVKGKAFAVTFTDRWASYYQGETTRLHVALRRYVPIWPDRTVVEKDVELPAASAYAVDFGQWLPEFSESLKPGSRYYVEWSFTRVGKVSKPTRMKAPDSPKATYGPALLDLAALE